MASVGTRLKEIREGKKLSLQTIAKNLNISISFLESIENDDFSKMPGEAYTIGYIRSYSNYLDLDAREIVKLYKDHIFTYNKKEPVKIPKPIETFNFFLSYKLISFFAVVTLSLTFYFLFIDEKINYPYYVITPDISENLQYKIEEIELEKALIDLKKKNKESLRIKSDNLSLDENNSLNNNVNISSAIAALPSDIEKQSTNNLITIKALDNTWIQL